MQALRSRASRIARDAGHWAVEVTGGAVFRAPVVVNAAWRLGRRAELAGAAPLGLVPMRRTACIIDPAPYDVAALADAARHGRWLVLPARGAHG